jgi:hypothetical protein
MLQAADLLLIPTLGLLWRISTQLATLTAVQREHERRLETLERRMA